MQSHETRGRTGVHGSQTGGACRKRLERGRAEQARACVASVGFAPARSTRSSRTGNKIREASGETSHDGCEDVI